MISIAAFSDLVTLTRASEGTNWDANGVLKTAAIDTPRFDHDPVTGEARGLLVEAASTNLLVQSNNIAAGGWSEATTSGPVEQGRYLQADVAEAPDGTITATKIVESTDLDEQRIFKAVSVVDGARYTFSKVLKAGERTEVQLRTTGRVGPVFDLLAGTMNATSSAMDDQGIMPWGDGWYRCWFTTTPNGTTDVPQTVLISGGASSYQGDGLSGLFAWGAQYEPGWGPTSLIVTGASALTRAADNVVYAGDPAALGLTQGYTLLGVGRAPRRSDPDGSAVLFGLGNASLNQRSTLAVRDFGLDGSYDPFFQGQAGEQSNPFGAPVSLTDTLKFALGVDVSGATGVLDGSVLYQDTVAGTVPDVTRIDIGALLGGTRKWGGTIERLVIYPRRLADAELQVITA